MSITVFRKHPGRPAFMPRHILTCAILIGAIYPAVASTSCVKQGGKSGCFSTIGAAVAAASPGSKIRVEPGTYKEDVVIGKALSLIGADARNTIIDATGLPNGLNINGVENPGLRNVFVSGFTIE